LNEVDWNICTDPREMLTFLRVSGKLSERKARLFAVACCRSIWPIMIDEVNRRAVEVAERFADGAATEQELLVAGDQAGRTAGESYNAAFEAARGTERNPAEAGIHAIHVHGAALAAGRLGTVDPANAAGNAVAALPEEGRSAERAAQAAVLRDLLGPLLFRGVRLDPAWLAWNNGTVPRLAEATYTERQLPSGHLDRTRPAILADALEEAGCSDPHLLDHLRDPGPHYRGCWPVDLLLSKS
jgi:hypothetical protein